MTRRWSSGTPRGATAPASGPGPTARPGSSCSTTAATSAAASASARTARCASRSGTPPASCARAFGDRPDGSFTVDFWDRDGTYRQGIGSLPTREVPGRLPQALAPDAASSALTAPRNARAATVPGPMAYRPSTPVSPSRSSSSRCSSAGASATCSPSRCAAARARRRGSSTRARRPPTGRPAPPRAHARLQGHLPALQDDARPLRRSARPAGTPTACRSRSRSRRSSGFTRKADIESYGIEEFNAQVPRVRLRRTSRTGTALTERIGFWVDLDDAYRTLDDELRRVRLVGAAQICEQGPAVRGPQGRPVLPALRHRAVRATRSRWATRTSTTRASTCASR